MVAVVVVVVSRAARTLWWQSQLRLSGIRSNSFLLPLLGRSSFAARLSRGWRRLAGWLAWRCGQLGLARARALPHDQQQDQSQPASKLASQASDSSFGGLASAFGKQARRHESCFVVFVCVAGLEQCARANSSTLSMDTVKGGRLAIASREPPVRLGLPTVASQSVSQPASNSLQQPLVVYNALTPKPRTSDANRTLVIVSLGFVNCQLASSVSPLTFAVLQANMLSSILTTTAVTATTEKLLLGAGSLQEHRNATLPSAIEEIFEPL